MPPLNKELIESNRFSFRQLDVFDVMPLLSEALGSLDALNKKIILTVSPVPIQTTFTNEDCVIANEFSKSVLRVCAQRLSKHYRNVDYFPSYEVVRTLGLTGYEDDNIHVKNSVVEKIT